MLESEKQVKYDEAIAEINDLKNELENLKVDLKDEEKFNGIDDIVNCASDVDTVIEYLNNQVDEINAVLERLKNLSDTVGQELVKDAIIYSPYGLYF